MKKEQWNEENLESLFKQAPKVTDYRTKDDVLKRLIDEGAFNEPSPQQKTEVVNHKGIRWSPLIASIASLFILVLIGSQFIGNQSISMDDHANEETAFSTEEKSTYNAVQNSESENAMIKSASMDMMAQQTVVFESQLADTTLFEIGLAGDDAESVPVSFLISNELVAEKINIENPTKLQLYETFAPLIDETSLGFAEYHPFKGTFREDREKLIHTLPSDQTYDIGTAAISNYVGALVDTFGDAYQEVQVENDKGEPIYFEHIGKMEEPIPLQDESTQYNYFTYQKRDSSIYLSPNFRMSYPNVKEAIENMTTEANDIFQTVILPEVTFSVKEKADIVTITFDTPLDIEMYDSFEAMRMIEGILLTAASFDKQIKFENIVQQQWSGFDFTKPIEKPIAANLMHYNF